MTTFDKPEIRLLAHLMSELSEEHWCAGWLQDCEYALWADLTGDEVNGIKAWGVSPESREELRLLHELADGWIIWSDTTKGQAFLPTTEWQAHLASIRAFASE